MSKYKSFLASLAVLTLFLPSIINAQSLGQLDAQAIQEYQAVKSRYANNKNQYLVVQKSYRDARAKWKNVQNLPDSQELLTQGKSYLLNGVDVLTKYLDMVQIKVEGSWLEQGDIDQIIKEISSDKSWLLAQKSSIESAKTRQDLTSLLKTSQSRWNKIRTDAKRYNGLILVSRYEYVHGRLLVAIDSVESKIEIGKEKGMDVSAATVQLDDAKAKLALAEAEYESAEVSYRSIISLSDADSKAAIANGKINKANQYIRNAHANLVTIAKSLVNVEVSSE